MCGLCGVLGGNSDWTDHGSLTAATATRRALRLERVRAANLILAQFGLGLTDWQGAHYHLSNHTGRTEIADNLSMVWQAAERILGRACDPLDPSLIERIEQIREMG
jgi:hypothetical protein